MIADLIAQDTPVPGRIEGTLIVTAIIMAILLTIYALFKRRDRVRAVVQHPTTAKIFQYALGVAAGAAFALSLFPRENPEMGILLYGVLWPLLALQIGIALLPWHGFAQKHPVITAVGAVIVIKYAVIVDLLMLGLAGYVQ